MDKDYKKVNRTRRARGYSWEYSLVNAFNNHPSGDWCARRLGGSSIGLPDIVATNNTKSILYSIEAKSGEDNILYVPADQIQRCQDITDKFLRIYNQRWIVFAFKFKGTKTRKLQYRIIPCDLSHYCTDLNDMKCISYNLSREQLVMHYNNRNSCIFDGIQATTSIDEFVNWV